MPSDSAELFASHSIETPWEWARQRRQYFKTPVTGLLAGCGTLVTGLLVRAIAGESNWLWASIEAGVVAILVGYGFPQLEALCWLWRRDAVRLEETEAALNDLKASAQSAAQEKIDPGARVRKDLGNLMLLYHQMERDFIAQGGAKELWNKQTRLHNSAMKVIDDELGRDYWAQFKDAKAVPLVVPENFPSGDAERLNLLYMIHGRSQWLGRVIDELRQAPVVVAARQVVHPSAAAHATASADVVEESQRLKDLRRIVNEAAEYVRGMPLGRDKAEDAIRAAYVVHGTIPELLTRAFIVPPTQEYLAFLEAEKQKRGSKFEMRVAAGDFLNRLSTRITEDNLDLGFLMPATWLQFRESDPELNWPANVR